MRGEKPIFAHTSTVCKIYSVFQKLDCRRKDSLVLPKIFREVISVVLYCLSMIVFTCSLTVRTASVQVKFFFALFVIELFSCLNLKSFPPPIISNKTKYHPC